LPEIERRMLADFPDRLWAWRADVALSKVAKQRWRHKPRDPTTPSAAITPAPVLVTSPPEPQMPRLRQHDVTIEKVAAAPLIRYPLFACFDDSGRLYVAEGTGQNLPGTELVKLNLGIRRRLGARRRGRLIRPIRAIRLANRVGASAVADTIG